MAASTNLKKLLLKMRPLNHLNAAGSDYPAAWQQIDTFRQGRGVDLPKWPAWCFLPMAAWYAIASGGGNKRLTLNQAAETGRLAALGTWRYSQGVYRFDTDVYHSLIDTVPTGEIPSAVLYRLPEWCVYIETPDLNWFDKPLHGFFAHLEWDANTQRHELRFLLDTDDKLVPMPLHIGQWTITEAVDRAFSESAIQAQKISFNFSPPVEAIEQTSKQSYALVSLLLYLCSDQPDINDKLQPGTMPSRPQPKRVKKGWRLFPAKKPKVWSVGNKIGDQIRSASANHQTDQAVTPHLRRAHWHGFWTGPRDGQRKFNYKWLPPTFVRGNNQ